MTNSVEEYRPVTSSGHHALFSLLVPGLGQFAQRRYLTAFLHFATVAAYLVSALALGGRRALLLALIWNVWSAIDAYLQES